MSDDDASAGGGQADPSWTAEGSGRQAAPEQEGRPVADVPAIGLAAQCEAAHRHFIGKLEAAYSSVDLRQTLAESEQELHRKLGMLAGPERELERLEATVEHLRLVRRLSPDEQRADKVAFAYARYLDELKSIWSRPDIHDIDPKLLSSLGESLAWAGYYAGLHVPAAPPRS